MIKKLINYSPKYFNPQSVGYILFHKHGICTSLLDSNLTKGEILIFSRFLNLVFTNKVISLSNMTDNNFGKLLLSLLNGLRIHKNHYYWITALNVFNNQSAIEFLGQSKQMMKEIRAIITDKSPQALNMVKMSLMNVSKFIIKLLEHILNNLENVNIAIVHIITRISCYLVMYLLEDKGLSGSEIKSLTNHLFKISIILKLKLITTYPCYILKDEVLVILKKLNTENILNSSQEVITFINQLLPYMSLHFDQNVVVQSLCTCCCSLLQRTDNCQESVQLITIAGSIVEMGSKHKNFIHDEIKVKALMNFIKILPNSVEHSDARNAFWWHMLCSFTPEILQNRFKSYFIPFLENILGVYLDGNNVSYGISDFNLSSGFFHLIQFANHVIINILDIVDYGSNQELYSISKTITVPEFMNLPKLDHSSFTSEVLSSDENMDLIFNAVEVWMQLLKFQRQKKIMEQRSIKINNINNNFPRRKPIQNKKKSIKKKSKLNKPSLNSEKFRKGPTKCLPSFSSSDDTSISNISSSCQNIYLQKKCKRKIEDDSSVIPEILPEKNISPLLKKQTEDIIDENISPSPSDRLFDLQKIIDFFKFYIPNEKETIIKKTPEIKSMSEIDQKCLPLKKRKINLNINDLPLNNSINNESCDTNPLSRDTCSESGSSTDEASSDDDKSSNNPKHKYYTRHNPYGSSRSTFPEQSLKSSGKGKLSKSNVDFSINVSETFKQPKRCKYGDKNKKSNSKKVEFKIKFDLNPLSKMCSKGIKLDIMKNKRSHSSTPRYGLIKG